MAYSFSRVDGTIYFVIEQLVLQGHDLSLESLSLISYSVFVIRIRDLLVLRISIRENKFRSLFDGKSTDKWLIFSGHSPDILDYIFRHLKSRKN